MYECTGEVSPGNEKHTFEAKSEPLVGDFSGDMKLIFTAKVLEALDIMRVWMVPQNEQHFLIVGGQGSAKT